MSDLASVLLPFAAFIGLALAYILLRILTRHDAEEEYAARIEAARSSPPRSQKELGVILVFLALTLLPLLWVDPDLPFAELPAAHPLAAASFFAGAAGLLYSLARTGGRR